MIANQSFKNKDLEIKAMQPKQKYRLVTRSDFDGIVCAVLLEKLDLIDDVLFVHPNDVQQGLVNISGTDISTNLPYIPSVYLAFDHHESEVQRIKGSNANHINDPRAPSAARVLYEYFGGQENFNSVDISLMEAVDKADSAQFTMEEVLNPQGWVMLNFLIDPRTGLGRFRGFRIPNYEFMMSLIDFISEKTISEILELPDVKERAEFYLNHKEKFLSQITRCATVKKNLVILDLRDEEVIFCGNRFLVYALFPDCNISMHILNGRRGQGVIFAVGKSIFKQNSNTNIGRLMLKYGGGGHIAAGTCQIDKLKYKAVKSDIIESIHSDEEI